MDYIVFKNIQRHKHTIKLYCLIKEGLFIYLLKNYREEKRKKSYKKSPKANASGLSVFTSTGEGS